MKPHFGKVIGNRWICPVCNLSISSGGIALMYGQAAWNNLTAVRYMHENCFFKENIEYLPSRERIKELKREKLLDNI